MLQTICQWFLVIHVVGYFLNHVYKDFYGIEAQPPKGYEGFIDSILGTLLLALAIYGAGAFQYLFGR